MKIKIKNGQGSTFEKLAVGKPYLYMRDSPCDLYVKVSNIGYINLRTGVYNTIGSSTSATYIDTNIYPVKIEEVTVEVEK